MRLQMSSLVLKYHLVCSMRTNPYLRCICIRNEAMVEAEAFGSVVNVSCSQYRY
jgi:hypothetical protein